jgi:hypothetical protein
MDDNVTPTRNADYSAIGLFLVLMFVGLFLAALGAKGLFLAASGAEPAVLGLFLLGGMFDLAVSFALRTRIPGWGILGAWIGMIVGGTVGIGLGLIVGSVIAWVGGILIAAVAGMMLSILAIGVVVAIPLGGLLEILNALGSDHQDDRQEDRLDDRVVRIGLLLAILGSGAIGVSLLREDATRTFGGIGGSAVAFGCLGMVVGLFAGYRASARTEM